MKRRNLLALFATSVVTAPFFKSEGSFKLLDQSFDKTHFTIRYDFPGSFLEFTSKISVDVHVKGFDQTVSHFLGTGDLVKIVRTVTNSHIEYKFECKDTQSSQLVMSALGKLKLGKSLA